MNERHTTEERAYVFFDLDRTVLKGDAFVYITKEAIRRGLFKWYEFILMALLLIQELFSVLFLPRLYARGFILYRNKSVAHVDQVISAVRSTIHDHVYTQAVEMIHEYKRKGAKIYIVTATFPQVAKQIVDAFGLDGYYGTQLKTYTRQGKEYYTGKTDGYLRGHKKAQLLHERFSNRLQNSASYSDSIIDYPFLSATAYPHAINPDWRLRHVARYKEWPIHHFTTTLGENQSMDPPPKEQ